ncbi:glycosidase [Corynebacterium kutscheri]|uniref:Glycosidase n=1 Tax=Corynebacterium kutscheri TaxID=35755 RepID=A0A0F6QYH8_9CORY|nr:glycoside hydrolase family 13 protein [Corynebacterium kutscheri]AKE40582.1 glycosidase [Corynebacterium kutscheri]VEH10977.1 putative amylase [Corynebacterium kutscheri]
MSQIIHPAHNQNDWWRKAVIYQIYPKSFASDKGAYGTLAGITSRLEHIANLGADAVWISPFYRSPQKDGGYDVSDYRDIDPLFGTRADAEKLIERAHELGLKVLFDLVPNHTSDQHAWFQEALHAQPGSAARQRYWFADGRGTHGELPPTDWLSVFGGSAWTKVSQRLDAPGSAWENDPQWYLNLFDSSQPDLNWSNEEVRAEFDDILRFWLRRGIDGFRVDVAHGLDKDPQLPDWQYHWEMVDGGSDTPADVPPPPMWNRPGVHEIYRRWNKVLHEFGTDKILVAEAWVDPLADYLRADEMHQAFNFQFLTCPWQPADLRRVIAQSYADLDSVAAPVTWVLSNHDVVRASSRMGLSNVADRPNGIRASDPQPDYCLGQKRSLSAHALISALPGGTYIYQGEELGLPEHTTLDDELREDPTFIRSHGKIPGRDGCRIPLPWVAHAPGFGFSPQGDTWLPQPQDWAQLAVDTQKDDPKSTLNFFRTMLALRRSLRLGEGELLAAEGYPDNVLAYINRRNGRAEILIITTFEQGLPMPAGMHTVLATQPVTDTIPAHTTCWLQAD